MADFVVIGGGFAGLAAAARIAESGGRVTLFERRGFLGGRAYSFVDATTGDVVDNGQHLFMGCYHHTIAFLRKIGSIHKLKFQETPQVCFLDARARLSWFRCPNVPPPWHLSLGLLRLESLGLRDKLRALAVGRALRAAGNGSPSGLNEISVETWLNEMRQSAQLQRNFWNPLAVAILNQETRRASADLFIRVLQQAFMAERSNSVIGISRVGLSELYTEDAAEFIRQHGGSVRLNATVSRIVALDRKAIGVELKAGEIIHADAIISAVPPGALMHLLPTPVRDTEECFQNLPRLNASPIVSINLWFDRPVTELEFAGLLGTRVQWLFNKDRIFARPRSDRMQLALVISAAADYIARSREELIDLALQECRQLMPTTRTAELRHALVVKEREATISHEVGTGRYRPSSRTPLRNLYLAGDWTDTGLPATIESAVMSGHRAAELALWGDS